MTQAPAADAYIGLGSNLAGPLKQVSSALQELAALNDTTLVAHSAWYRSAAGGPGRQPDSINGVAHLRTGLPPAALLQALQGIENRHRRVRRERWGPRTLDLDMLLYGQLQIDSETLQLPHPRLAERNFVLYPLAEVAPHLTLPNGIAVASLLARCPRGGLERLGSSE